MVNLKSEAIIKILFVIPVVALLVIIATRISKFDLQTPITSLRSSLISDQGKPIALYLAEYYGVHRRTQLQQHVDHSTHTHGHHNKRHPHHNMAKSIHRNASHSARHMQCNYCNGDEHSTSEDVHGHKKHPVDVFYIITHPEAYEYIQTGFFWAGPYLLRHFSNDGHAGNDTRIHIFSNSSNILGKARLAGFFAHDMNEMHDLEDHFMSMYVLSYFTNIHHIPNFCSYLLIYAIC